MFERLLKIFFTIDFTFKRETRFERATSTLARLRSTTELHPQVSVNLLTSITMTERLAFVNSLFSKLLLIS
jgi:hypothetical protein